MKKRCAEQKLAKVFVDYSHCKYAVMLYFPLVSLTVYVLGCICIFFICFRMLSDFYYRVPICWTSWEMIRQIGWLKNKLKVSFLYKNSALQLRFICLESSLLADIFYVQWEFNHYQWHYWYKHKITSSS